MEAILAGWENIVIFVDDILIFDGTMEGHSKTFSLREICKSKVDIKVEQQELEKLKRNFSDLKYLEHFDPKLWTKMNADASPVGLGAVLVQFHGTESRPIAHASKSLTDQEKIRNKA